MARYGLGIEYCGDGYSGWQRQKQARSIQHEVERAISQVAAHPLQVVSAGRTDAGVHACMQVAHFDSDCARECRQWVLGGNSLLPRPIRLLWCQSVAPDFHARFMAIKRSYRYVILNRAVAPSYLAARATWYRRPLALAPMQQAAQPLLGKHDFSAYRAAHCQSHQPIKEIYTINMAQHEHWFWLDITADGFLHHMVRNIVGVLLAIGSGDAAVVWAKQVLDGGTRAHGGLTASADGLYFVGAQYAARFGLPTPTPCRFW